MIIHFSKKMVMQRLYISNKDRVQGLAYDFLLSDVSGSFTNSSTFIAKVVQVDFENFATTIIQGQNDVFTYQLRNNALSRNLTVTVTFPQGVYPISGTGSLLEFIQNRQDTLTSAQGWGTNVLNWGYNTVSKKIFVTSVIAGHYVQVLKTINPTFPFQESTPQLRLIDALGLDSFCIPNSSTQNLGANGTSYAADIVDISTSAFMDIGLNLASNTLSTANLNRMIVARVPVNVPYGEVVTFMENHPLEFLLNTQQMNSLRVTCYNQWNQFYVLPDNANLSIILQLENID
jgi:hypothetical protein